MVTKITASGFCLIIYLGRIKHPRNPNDSSSYSIKEIDMTAPVTQSENNGQMVMRFFLPSNYSKQNAPKPTDKRVQIIDLPDEYFAVISYSGFASDSNFIKHHEELKVAMERDGLIVTGPPLKATYNSPFNPPFLRRNEAM